MAGDAGQRQRLMDGAARRMWVAGEPLHALVYFAPECREAAEAAGLRGFWAGYFAMRAAPLGPVGAEVVTATFYNFAPAFVARRVPAVWDSCPPAGALAARLAGVDAALRRVVPDWAGSAAAREAAGLARTAAAAVEVAGRPLAAGEAAQPWPEAPHLALWQALTVLREHRGDGHLIALGIREVGGLESHVLASAATGVGRDWLLRARGWDDAAWDAAAGRLAARGWLDGQQLTPAGRDARAAIEADTDRLAAAPWAALGDDGCARLAELLTPVRRAVADAGLWPAGNPIGVPDL